LESSQSQQLNIPEVLQNRLYFPGDCITLIDIFLKLFSDINNNNKPVNLSKALQPIICCDVELNPSDTLSVETLKRFQFADPKQIGGANM
jgi:hypothetical protein